MPSEEENDTHVVVNPMMLIGKNGAGLAPMFTVIWRVK